MLFNYSAWFFMVAMTWVSVAFTKLPGAYFYLPEPSVAAIVIYYAVVLAAFSGWFKTARRQAFGAVILAVVAAGCLWQWQSSRAETGLAVLPLDGGHAVYVDAPGRRNDWLINCGGKNAATGSFKDYLRGQGVNFVPRLVLADGNTRNCGGAPLLNQLFGIGEIWTSDVTFRSPAYREAVAGLPGPAHKILKPGQTNGCWRVLFPPATPNGAELRAEDAPLVLLGTFHGTRVLLLSELSRDGQSQLLAQTNAGDLRADIVVAGLPDQGEPLCNDLDRRHPAPGHCHRRFRISRHLSPRRSRPARPPRPNPFARHLHPHRRRGENCHHALRLEVAHHGRPGTRRW